MNTNNEFEYYLIGSDYKPTTPLLRGDDDQDTLFLSGDKPVTDFEEPMQLCFNSPIPKKIKMVDYHALPNSVISRKIADALKPLDIYGIQLIPTKIRNNKTNDIYPDYFVVYVYNTIKCLDMKHAEYKTFESNGKIQSINKLILDKEILSKIPLEKRLVFLLGEARSMRIYHKSIVDAIMAVNPEGIIFRPIKEWYEGIQFNPDSAI